MAKALEQRLRIGRESQMEQRLFRARAAQHLGIEAVAIASRHRGFDAQAETYPLSTLG